MATDSGLALSKDLLKLTGEGAGKKSTSQTWFNCDSDLNEKAAYKRAIGGRGVKGFAFNKSCAKTTLNLKRFS